MTPDTDERRAREITRLNMARLVKNISAEAAWDQASINMRADANLIARAIRASDEAAGVVLVPFDLFKELYHEGYEELHPDTAKRAKEIIAAMEADNG